MSGVSRFGRPRGRFFSTRDEMQRMDRAMEIQQQVFGDEVEWYFHLPRVEEGWVDGSVSDDIYDEGLVTSGDGGKRYDGPLRIPVLGINVAQGQEVNDDQGFATYDHVKFTASYEQLRRAGLDRDLIGNREEHLHDRFVWRDRVFDVESIQTSGHFEHSGRDMTVLVTANQVRSDELYDSPIFAKYAHS